MCVSMCVCVGAKRFMIEDEIIDENDCDENDCGDEDIGVVHNSHHCRGIVVVWGGFWAKMLVVWGCV